MKFPKRLRHNGKGRVLVTVYKRSDGYRLYWRVQENGKRVSRFKDFSNYSEAKKHADPLVKDLAKGKAATLSPGQMADALVALERLQTFFQSTGRRVSLLSSVSEYCEAAAKLNGFHVGAAVDGYLNSLATVKRKDIDKAVGDFIEIRRLKTIPRHLNKRPDMSVDHHNNTARWLREFGGTFPGHAVSDLTKGHIDQYMKGFTHVGPKTKNERRSMVKMFLKWAVEMDYLGANHRLLEAGGLKQEIVDLGDVECYTPDEFRAMLNRTNKRPASKAESDFRPLLPVLALAGLAGLRFKELLRLDWEDVFRIADHIEVKAYKAKTRSRRLISMCPALALWLANYRNKTGRVWTKGYHMLHEDFAKMRQELKIEIRRNGLRHSFISAHFAAYSDENLTSAQAGNSPAIVHKHYKGLLTKQHGVAWFSVSPQDLK